MDPVRSWFWRLAVGGSVLLATGAGAATWPGAAPCNGTLQACIDGVASGSVVELVNSVANEDLLIAKSLTLRAAAGKLGVIGAGATTRQLQIQGSSGAVNVTLQGLSFENAAVSVDLEVGSGHHVTIRRCSIRNEALSNNTRAIDLFLLVPATVVAEYNDIETNGDGIALYTTLASGTASLSALGNQITAVTPALSGNGIALDLRGAGTVNADLYSNLIHGVSGCNCGGAAGIQGSFSGSVGASIGINNNTLDDIQGPASGIRIYASSSSGSVAVDVFNNIVTRATQAPVYFPAFSAGLLISSGFNDFFDNAAGPVYGGFPAGAGVITSDPMFTSAFYGDYHLKDGSPAIDAGTAVPPGGLPTFDADGKSRKIGAFPDLGAFEVPEAGATSAGAAAALALAAMRRRRQG
jgi:hypothetical protein